MGRWCGTSATKFLNCYPIIKFGVRIRCMIYILVELNGFRQLKKMNNDFAVEIVDNMKTAFSGDLCKFIEQKNNVFLYSCTPGEYDLSSLFNNTINLYNYLKSISDDLLGYNILLDQLQGDFSKEQSGILLHRLFLLPKDASFYITEELLPFFDSFAEFVTEGIFNRLISYSEYKQDNEENIVSFLSKVSGIERYLESLTPFINNDKHGLLYFHEADPENLSYISYCIAYLLQGKTIDAPWLFITSEKSKIFNINSLINCMNTGFIGIVSNYLSEPELTIWNDRIHLVLDRNRIIFDEDAIILFRIYLKAYSARMAELYLPAIVFIPGSHMFEELTLEYIAIVLEDLYIDLDLIPVLFSNEEDLPASFHGFQSKKISFKGWILDKSEETDQRNNQLPLTIDSPVSFFHSSMLLKHNKGVFPGIEATHRLLDDMGHTSKHFLMIYSLFYDLCGKELLISYLSIDQSDKLKNEKLYNELVFNGFICPDNLSAPVFSEINQVAATEVCSDDLLLIDRITNDIEDNFKGCKLAVFEKIAYIYRKLELFDKETLYLLKTIELLIDSGKTEKTGIFFGRIADSQRSTGIKTSKVELRQNICFLKGAIYDNKDEFATDVYLRLCSVEMNEPALDSERKIACSDYLYAMFKYKKGLDLAKLALLDIQDSDDTHLKTRVNLNLARILMGMKRIDESKDYFRIARETVDRDSDIFMILEISTHESVVNFIYGNFSESLRLVTNSRSICYKSGRRDWELFLIFMNGRILFELGNYKDAIVLFSEGLRFCDVYFNGNEKTFFNIWIGRCFIYLKQYRFGIKILNDYDSFPEALYFSAEGLYFQEEYNNAFKKIESAFIYERDRIRLFCSSNIISWESGYDFIEDRSFVVEGDHGVLFQLIRAFRAFLMAKTGNETEGCAELVKLTREERLSDIDLNNGYYYYLHSLTLPEHTGAEAVDRLTLLSKALRHIQKTASHIDDPKVRQQFLMNNYWNSGLMKDGRAHKLI